MVPLRCISVSRREILLASFFFTKKLEFIQVLGFFRHRFFSGKAGRLPCTLLEALSPIPSPANPSGFPFDFCDEFRQHARTSGMSPNSRPNPTASIDNAKEARRTSILREPRQSATNIGANGGPVRVRMRFPAVSLSD